MPLAVLDQDSQDAVITRHFVAQQRRPADLATAKLASIPAHLRGLIVSDATVTTYLEGVGLEPIVAEPHDSTIIREESSPWLEIIGMTEVLRRRVVLRGLTTGRTYCWAQAHIVLSRLPSVFRETMERHPRGFGAALRETVSEHRRELLWFGESHGLPWPAPLTDKIPFVGRAYKVYLQTRPAALIEEYFLPSSFTQIA